MLLSLDGISRTQGLGYSPHGSGFYEGGFQVTRRRIIGLMLALFSRTRPRSGPNDLTAPFPYVLCMHFFSLSWALMARPHLASTRHSFLCTFGSLFLLGYFHQGGPHNDMLSVNDRRASYSTYQQCLLNIGSAYIAAPKRFLSIRKVLLYAGSWSSRSIRLDMWLARTGIKMAYFMNESSYIDIHSSISAPPIRRVDTPPSWVIMPGLHT